MRGTISVGITVDGFIARPDGDVNSLGEETDEPEEGGEDYGFAAFMKTVDALVMGRNTWDVFVEFGVWPYGDTPMIVLTSRPMEIPEMFQGNVETMSGPPRTVAETLAARGLNHLYIDGGVTAQAFLREGLVQRIVLTRIPILIGEGIPLFGPLEKDIRLRLIRSDAYPDGFQQSEYEVVS